VRGTRKAGTPRRRHPRGHTLRERHDLVVVGGGLAGVCAAIAGARRGLKTALVQDRPVLGGNSSSEIRVNIGGANNCNAWARETGIIEEIVLEDRARNHEWARNGAMNSIWDLVLYEWVKREENLALHLNTVVNGVEKDGDRLSAVTGVQAGSERTLRLRGRFFVDATGDGTVGALAGAESRFGRESRKEFGESLAPEKADLQTQGSSLMLRARDVGRPVSFVPPSWAEEYPTEQSLVGRGHGKLNATEYAGYWWIEIGVPYDIIDQNEEIRDEALRHLMGVWDHIKNHGNHGAENLALDWIGTVPGKRESRRLMGDYLLTQNDLLANTPFPDRVAYGGWFMDIHTMGGILTAKEGKPPLPNDQHPWVNEDVVVRTYNIPLRSLYSRDVDNLFLAGRDISATHCALGSTRLMLTCALMGQAVGTAAAIAKKHRTTPRGVARKHIHEVQQALLKDDAFILDLPNDDPDDIARKADAAATSCARLSLEPVDRATALDCERAQIIPVTAGRIHAISLHVRSELEEDAELAISVAPATDIWEFAVSGKDAATCTAVVRAGSARWVEFKLNLDVPEPGLYQVSFPRLDGVALSEANAVPGVCTAWKRPEWTRWHGAKMTFAMRLGPPASPFEANNVINGNRNSMPRTLPSTPF